MSFIWRARTCCQKHDFVSIMKGCTAIFIILQTSYSIKISDCYKMYTMKNLRTNLPFHPQNNFFKKADTTTEYRIINFILIIRITFSKKVDGTIYPQYYPLSIPVIKNSCYQWLYPAIHCKEYDKITMINETRQNIVVLTTDIFAVYVTFFI